MRAFGGKFYIPTVDFPPSCQSHPPCHSAGGEKRPVPPNLFHLEAQRLSWESNADTVTTGAKAAAPLWSPQSCGNGVPAHLSLWTQPTRTETRRGATVSQSVTCNSDVKFRFFSQAWMSFCLLSLFCFTSRQRDLQTMRFTPHILHWLPVHFRMALTILSSVFKPLNGPVPGYCVGTLESLCIALSKTRPKMMGHCTPIKAFCKMLYIETAWVLIFIKWLKTNIAYRTIFFLGFSYRNCKAAD